MAKGALIFPSFYEAIKDLPDDDRLTMYDALCRYTLEGKEPQLKGETRRLWVLMQPNIDSSNHRYAATVENGKKGGAPIGNQNARKKTTKNNQTFNQRNNHDLELDSDSDLELDSDSYSDSEHKDDAERLFKRLIEANESNQPKLTLPTEKERQEAYNKAMRKLEERPAPL